MDENILLVKRLSGKQVLKSPNIVNAFIKMDRQKFIPKNFIESAYEDRSFPSAAGQHISEPSTVAFMLELLDIKPGNRVLNLGSGTGWTTALIGELVGPSGHVVGVEIMPTLLEIGRRNILQTQLRNIEFVMAQKELGCREKGPYDRIQVTASIEEVPYVLIEQLEVNGILVIPINNKINKIIKTSETDYETRQYEGYIFDPIVHTDKSTETTQSINSIVSHSIDSLV